MDMNKMEEMEVDLLKMLKALWRKAWVVILTAVIFGVCAWVVTAAFVTPKYKARALMYVNSSSISVGSTKVSISEAEINAAQSLVDTYVVILNTRSTLNDVIEQTGVNYTYEQLIKMVSAASVNSTEVFYIEVTSPDPKEAELLANAIAQILPEKISSVVEGSSTRIVDYAVEPSKKDSPNLLLNVVICMLLGGVLACCAIVVAELMDRQIHDSDYLIQSYDLPVLAVIPDLFSNKNTNDYYQSAGRQADKTR